MSTTTDCPPLPQQIEALRVSMSFLAKDPIYQTEKPYRLAYTSPSGQSENFVRKPVDNIPVQDLRGIEHDLTFERNGIAVLDFESSMTYDDFGDTKKILDCYCKEIAQVILEYTGGKAAHVFDHNVRRRSPTYPAVTAPTHVARDQPTRNVHIDATPESLAGLLEQLEQDGLQQPKSDRVILLNAWRPLRGPVEDWPIALCDANTVIPSRDFMPTDHVVIKPGTSERRVVENFAVFYHSDQRWLYLSGHQPSELLLFRQVDSNGSLGVPHGSFDLANVLQLGPLAQARESIEVRALVWL